VLPQVQSCRSKIDPVQRRRAFLALYISLRALLSGWCERHQGNCLPYPQEEAIITGGALLAVCEALEERTLPVLAITGTTPEAIPEVRAETPESQENQAAENRETPVIHSIPVRERV
jgi:hypothetical protein